MNKHSGHATGKWDLIPAETQAENVRKHKMKKTAMILFLFLNINSYGQYFSPTYDKINYVNSKGDTINRIDKDSLYQGEWILFSNSECLINDTTPYKTGHFKNGKPVGLWKCYNKNNYGIGRYRTGKVLYKNEKGKTRFKRNNALGITKGVWKIYNHNDSLIRYEKEHRKAFLFLEWEISLEKNVSENRFRKTEKHYWNWLFDNYTSIQYYSNGKKESKEVIFFCISKEIEYYPNGKIKEIQRCRNKRMSSLCITKKYSETGKRIEKSPKKIYRGIMTPAF